MVFYLRVMSIIYTQLHTPYTHITFVLKFRTICVNVSVKDISFYLMYLLIEIVYNMCKRGYVKVIFFYLMHLLMWFFVVYLWISQ